MLEKARQKLILWNVVVVISLLVAVIVALYFAIAISIQNEVDNDLTHSAANLVQATRFIPLSTTSPSNSSSGSGSNITPSVTQPTLNPGNGRQGDEKEEKDEHDTDESGSHEGKLETSEDLKVSVSNNFYFVVDATGTILANPRQITSPNLPDLSILPQALKGQNVFKELKIEKEISIRLYSVPLRVNDRVVGMLQVGEDLTPHQQQLRSVLVVTGIVALGGSILAVLAAVFLTRRALVPVRLAMQRQRDFVADASHELRTPLTIIQANTEVALRNKSRTIGEKAALLEDIHQETEYLGRLISDLLILAQTDSHQLQLKLEPVELIRMVEAMVRQLTPLAEAKKLDLQITLPPTETELWLVGDPLRLKQLLLILLDNAIKYTPEGGRVRLTVKRGRSSQLILEIEDSGIGIPLDKQALIFERFYRVDKARTRSEGGFGLGLSIARWIVQAHKGSIQVSSQPGQGTTFTVNLPTNLPQEFNTKKLK